MNEAEQDEAQAATIGERLKAAREARKMRLDDIAAKTRIPIRHLEHIERGEWDSLPAITYCVGFVKAYASSVGLDGVALGQELREELGVTRDRQMALPDYFEPADPARVPPKSIAMIAAIVGILLLIGYGIWRSGMLDGSNVDEAEVVAEAGEEAPPPAQNPAQQKAASLAAAANGPVVITATEDVWLRIYEANGGPKLVEKILVAGERYEVPATAAAPQILTGRPNAIRVTVGTVEIPPLGAPERTIADVSLRPADLLARLGQPQAQPAAAAPAPPPAAAKARPAAARPSAAQPAPVGPPAAEPAPVPPPTDPQVPQ